jgi:ribosomal protein S27AE
MSSRPDPAEHKRICARVQYAVKTGRLEKTPCVECGDEKVQGHHEDYAQPLVVEWLCAACHTVRHLGERIVLVNA